ncbi:fumarylacetoacetase [Flavobacterium cellulosilyticum]|uniref:fumarylacetoacetase n=1 Tax=Flavobacterium cellulosilyticum TaxID=2541731 RepID=A0A4R5CBH5_9FLAO|nr:fumarylacetoacetase [Flavobacterium cellulosilyticum]TDD97311.1 fumarylacetoacetase [Flavobacterium cellulosilyticum]
MKTWVTIPNQSDFTIDNIPFGIYSTHSTKPTVCIAIGDQILDLVVTRKLGIFKGLKIKKRVLKNNFLNDFIALGKEKTNAIREIIQKELCDEDSKMRNVKKLFSLQSEVQMHLPIAIGDYTDFYSSIEHATNVGMMFRDPANALLPNWKHLPVGYHGRASSIIVSGENIHRPMGQVMPPDVDFPVFKASSRVDFELEMGFIIGKNTNLGEKINTIDAENYIFGQVLFNDWSARDIQKWEYVPLGPFLAKSFASSMSPWVVTMEALVPFKVKGPEQEPKVLPYLEYEGLKNYDIELAVAIQPKDQTETIVSNSNFKYMYWNMSQQLAHHTSNGCNVKIGDLMASGTISGKEPNSYGSMLELSWGGKNPILLENGEKRTFIEDFDTVIMRGYCEKGAIRVGFGEVRSQLLPPL